MDWTTLIVAGVGLVVGALAKHVVSGKPPIIDPTNQRPLIDLVRDAVRNALKDYTSAPPVIRLPVPIVPPAFPPSPVPSDLAQLLNQLFDFLKQQQADQKEHHAALLALIASIKPVSHP